MDATSLEMAQNAWRDMETRDRQCLLNRFSVAVKRNCFVDWDGKLIRELAAISSFDALPRDLQAELVAAATAEGFSIETLLELRRTEAKHRAKRRAKP